MRKTVTAVSITFGVFDASQSFAQDSKDQIFEGFVADKYPIVMSIRTADNFQISGTYYYKKNGTDIFRTGVGNEDGFFGNLFGSPGRLSSTSRVLSRLGRIPLFSRNGC